MCSEAAALQLCQPFGTPLWSNICMIKQFQQLWPHWLHYVATADYVLAFGKTSYFTFYSGLFTLYSSVNAKIGPYMTQLSKTLQETTGITLGTSRWPRTLAGITAYLPCNRLSSGAGIYSGSSGEEQRAWRRCDRGGLWAEEDYSRCQYQKDVTRFLYVINQVSDWLLNWSTARSIFYISFIAFSTNFIYDLICIYILLMNLWFFSPVTFWPSPSF